MCSFLNVYDTLASMGCDGLTIMRRKQNCKINSVTEEIDSVYVLRSESANLLALRGDLWLEILAKCYFFRIPFVLLRRYQSSIRQEGKQS